MHPVLAVTGLAKEARLAAGPGVEAVGAGGSPERLRARLAARPTPGCRAVVSFGISGGLDPTLAPGAIVIANAIVTETGRHEADAAIRGALLAALAAAGLRVLAADVVGVETAVLSIAAKAELRDRTGAAAVDMESHVAADYAARHGLPLAAIRVVCDPAGRALPPFAAHALKPDGEPDIRAVLTALARGDARLGDLIRLARDASVAFRALARCRARLGPDLGLAQTG
ncbi:phosphorylase [uncultured Methylobacterium sp.]|uniref:phosphorylase n=1 Tax=uncultured Methylobacterium sp. TaxID=157278 RepID=UPI0035C95856